MEKIVFLEVEPWEDAILKEKLGDQNVVFKETKLDSEKDTDIFDATILSTFINSQLDRDHLSKFTNLKLLVTRSTGYDHIDLDYCKEKNITVCNVPAYGVHTVAEHTIALLLTISRNIIPSVARTRRGDFSQTGLEGMELYGKSLGVIGAGNIGTVVIEIARGIGMKILAYSRHPEEHPSTDDIKYVGLDELLENSDVVTLHVPLTPDTKHMINMDNIGKMKKGSILINAARGGLVDTQAIVEGLEKGILRAAGLDVLEEECDMKEEKELLTGEFLNKCDPKTALMNHVLLNREDVVVTPHNAFNSHEAVMQILHTTIDDITGFLNNQPVNVVGK